jgi:DNA-binding XRE family transcriptional regulator
MRTKIKIPRILKIEEIKGLMVVCTFNNGESRLLNFSKIFNNWDVSVDDFEYPLLEVKEFQKVELRNHTLSWPNILIPAIDEQGSKKDLPYEIGSDVLFELSEDNPNKAKQNYGRLLRSERKKAGLTQEQLAKKSGTTRFYISRIENDKTDFEMSTLRKIVETGLGKKLKLTIE